MVVHGVMATDDHLNFNDHLALAIVFAHAGLQPPSGQFFDQDHAFAVPVVFAFARFGQRVDVGLDKAAF